MQLDSALLTGVLFGTATWLILQGSFVRILFGFILLSHAVNLLVLTMSGEPSGKQAPLATESGPWVDPLPQAMILTAIVISFGVTAYLVGLLYRLFLDHGTTHAGSLYAGDSTEHEKTK
ncbi:MAG: NADH-quinone oxidoreductase subunit K [Verrucomicrobiota bacterium]|nr:NADH-quinone oxidoreductase subunit K [Limisphaera sp.]MDW8382151.1 NADH-quinone oxidoreductase subunit K [Verrucomicrobiota bacterium]